MIIHRARLLFIGPSSDLSLWTEESWTDVGSLIHDLEVADMRTLRMIKGINRRTQWEERLAMMPLGHL